MVEVVYCGMSNNTTMIVQYNGVKYRIPQSAANPTRLSTLIYLVHRSHLTAERIIIEVE